MLYLRELMEEKKYGLAGSSRDRFNSLLKEVLLVVKPSKKEHDDAKLAMNDIMGRLMKQTPKDVEILLAGSFARNTQIRGKSDIDVFLLFPRSTKESAVEKKGLEVAKKIVNKKKNESYIVKYAEHPYTRLFLNDLNINVDIVPAYKIKDAGEMGTAVDRTQLHNKFIDEKLSERQRDEVRLLKAFLKEHKVYGAEARIEGFSGYLCELLICNYGSFLNVVTAIANIKLPLIINIMKLKVDERDPKTLLKLFDKKFIVIDPTDSNRNVAANVSDESLFRFVLAARKLLQSPSKESFYGKGLSDIYSEKKLLGVKNALGANLYVLHFEVPEIADDIIWQQLRRTRLRLNDVLKANEFTPEISLQNLEKKDAVIGFFIKDFRVTTTRITGPNLEMGEAVDRFMKAHKNSMFTFIENDRIYCIEKAKHTNPEELIRSFLTKNTNNLPSNFSAKKATLFVNKVPEKHAKLIYVAYSNKFSI